MDAQAVQKFLDFDYKEVKDLSTEFLKLTSGILVLSITFSEKVARNASSKHFLVLSWFWFIVALLLSGLSLASMFNAAIEAQYQNGNFLRMGDFAYFMLAFAGLAFVTGLICLMISAVLGYKTGHS